MKTVDVAILGAGISGLTAAYHMRNRDIEVLEAEDYVGGRTKSQKLPNGLWVNYGAIYVSHDKTKLISLIDEVGVKTLPSELGAAEGDEIDRWAKLHEVSLSADDRRDIEVVLKRITSEQLNPRPLADPYLDDQSFLGWLGDVSPHTYLFFESICNTICDCSALEVSLVGFLWAFGMQRTSPWMPKEYWDTSGRGDLVVEGGTGEIAAAIAKALDGRVQLNTKVLRAIPEGGEVRIEFLGPEGRGELRAKSVVSALPAPLAAEVIEGLPEWKQSALESIRYGKFVTTPMAVNPSNVEKVDTPLTVSRPEPPHTWIYGRANRLTPGDIDQVGGSFASITNDKTAVQIWNDPDDSIKSGCVKAFQRLHPGYADRLAFVGIKRWDLGLPQLRTGRMKLQDDIVAPSPPFYFCGDYTWGLAHMDSAARSGERAAQQVLDAAA